MDPNTPIDQTPGIGLSFANKLKKLNILTVEDLIYHFPFRWEDFSNTEKIKEIKPDEKITVVGVVWQIKNIRLRNGRFITNATVADESGTIEVVWFYQPYLTKTIKAGMSITLSGKAKIEGKKVKMLSPQYEILRSPDSQLTIDPLRQRSEASDKRLLHTGRLVAVYPETEGLTSKWIRVKIDSLINLYTQSLPDFLPSEITKRENLLPLKDALLKIHKPENYKDVEAATKRLSFDELFLVQLVSRLRKKDWQEKRRAHPLEIDEVKINTFIKNLPFKLTRAQLRSTQEILTDLNREIPTNRLLEGDVGSGKTVVAAIAAYVSLTRSFDVLLAAPTEILAFQHQKTLEALLLPYKITVGIWTGSKKIAGDITCGTHALLTTFKAKREVGLVIVDEQHRFGVAQRAKLFLEHSQKLTPHLLTMTATPIPRTLALTLYGDLDLSVLDEMPLGRKKIDTFVVPNIKRKDAYGFIEKQVEEGRQAFILTPFVEPSESMTSVKAAVEEFEKLKNKFSKNIKLGLLHGRLKSKEKEAVIEKFKKNKINILVTTPVVEVGIDIPNATIMMIESSERFGLAQLHQLRGRVGRGEHKSYCLLFSDSNSPNSLKRLKSLEKIDIGFELAQIDLNLRGQGDIFGLKQSGFESLKIADISDEKLVSSVQNEAKLILEKDPSLRKHPELSAKIAQVQSEFSQPN